MAEDLAARIREPLRLPHGSVRGTIGLIVTGTYAYLLLRGGAEVPPILINSVVVVIAFYFGTRAATTPPTVATPGRPLVPATPTTRHTKFVRGILLLAFGGLAAWFLRANPTVQGIPPALLAVLEVLGGYGSGLIVSWLVHRRAHENIVRKRFATLARDLIAIGALALTAYTCFALATGETTIFADRVVDALSLVVTFYFGSRVIGR